MAIDLKDGVLGLPHQQQVHNHSPLVTNHATSAHSGTAQNLTRDVVAIGSQRDQAAPFIRGESNVNHVSSAAVPAPPAGYDTHPLVWRLWKNDRLPSSIAA